MEVDDRYCSDDKDLSIYENFWKYKINKRIN